MEKIMKPQSAKSKGRNLQKITRDLILELNPELQNDDVQSRSMGAQGEDVMLSPAARKWVPFQIECKNKEHVAVYSWYQQARDHGPHQPMLVIKENFADPLVIIDAALFFKILRRYVELGTANVQNPSA
jgi:hypothetical protein